MPPVAPTLCTPLLGQPLHGMSPRRHPSSNREACLLIPAPLAAADYLQQQKLAAAVGTDPAADGAPPSAELLRRQWQRVMLTSLAEDPGEAGMPSFASSAGCLPSIMSR